jgi:vang-like
MSRSLQKYLRITRQQPYFTREAIILHLSTCLSHDLSPRTFLERYIQIDCQPLATLLFPALQSTTKKIEQSWLLTCDNRSIDDKHETNKIIGINRAIYANLTIILKQQHAEHIALLCTFHAMPRVYLFEKFFDLKQNQFVLKLNSETSV